MSILTWKVESDPWIQRIPRRICMSLSGSASQRSYTSISLKVSLELMYPTSSRLAKFASRYRWVPKTPRFTAGLWVRF